MRGLKRRWQRYAASLVGESLENKILAPQPTQPWRRDRKKGGGTHCPEAEGQAVSKATPCSIPKESWRTAAECRKYRCVVCSSSSHVLGGHGDKALTSIGMLPHGWGHEAKSLTSIRMLPHCKRKEKNEGWSTQGLRQ